MKEEKLDLKSIHPAMLFSTHGFHPLV